MTLMAHYLLVQTLDALDLRAAETAMVENDFEVTFQRLDDPAALKVIWQPDPVVHPEHQSGGILDKPPVEVHELRFETGEPAARIRRDIEKLLAEEGQQVPQVLTREGMVHLQEIDTEEVKHHTTAMLYAVLCELAATASRKGDVVIFDPAHAICFHPPQVREFMNWRDMIYLLENPIFTDESPGEVLTPEAGPAQDDDQNSRPDQVTPMLLSPGQQASSALWPWLVAGAATVVGAAWYWVRR